VAKLFRFNAQKHIDLKKFFRKEIKRNIVGSTRTSFPTYKSLIAKRKQGILLDPAPSNAPSTRKRKGKDHWMVDTGDLVRNGFGSWSKKHQMRVYAKQNRHSGKYTYAGGTRTGKAKNPPTYYKLFTWHNADGYSGVFQQLPKGSQFPKRLEKEIMKQMRKAMSGHFKNIKVSL
jgi:hypothetical protein|tara:strand:+ start:1178 stop:1699 length:522 start_codon:yes stop_codon:yes gene_type:complete